MYASSNTTEHIVQSIYNLMSYFITSVKYLFRTYMHEYNNNKEFINTRK